MNDEINSVDLGEEFIAHYGVKGMHWGIRKDPDGSRPIARALNDSAFGRLANANANRYMRKQNTKAAARGIAGPKKSTSSNPDRKTINRNAAIDAARAAGVNRPKSQSRSTSGRSSRLTATRDRDTQALRRVAAGQASVRDHLRASGSISLFALVRNGGYRNAADARATSNINRNNRIALGQTTVADRLHQWGNIPMFNFGGRN